jgi:hypothetical protein
MADNKPGPLTELYKIFRIVDRGDILDNTVGTKDYNDISSSPQLKLFVNKVMGNLSNGRGLPSLSEISEFHSSRLKDLSERNLPISFFSVSNDSSSPQNSNLGISEKKSQVSRYFSPGLVKSLFSIKGYLSLNQLIYQQHKSSCPILVVATVGIKHNRHKMQGLLLILLKEPTDFRG